MAGGEKSGRRRGEQQELSLCKTMGGKLPYPYYVWGIEETVCLLSVTAVVSTHSDNEI